VQGFYKLDSKGQREFVEFTDKKPVHEWIVEGSGVRFLVAPVVACLDVKMTVGLGDFISASGF